MVGQFFSSEIGAIVFIFLFSDRSINFTCNNDPGICHSFGSFICYFDSTKFTQKSDFNFNNEKVDDDRKIDYLYDVMTSYRYAKEIRINNASKFIRSKFKTLFQVQLESLRLLMKKNYLLIWLL